MARNEARFREAEQRLWASFGVTPTEQRVRLPRIGTTVRVQELGEGPAVLFVHGGSNGGSSWAPLAARLPGFRCLLLDRPGCGLSGAIPRRLADYDAMATFADGLIVDFLDALELETADVISTSFGGCFALRAAAKHPRRISRLLEFGYPIGAPASNVPMIMRMPWGRVMARLSTLVPQNERSVRMTLRQIGLAQALRSGNFTDIEVAWFLSLMRDTDTMRNEIAAGPSPFRLRGDLNPKMLLPDGLLGSIQCPVRFLWGEEDPFGGPESARAFVGKVPGAELELVPGAGHAVWMDDPDWAARATQAFLSPVNC